MFLVRPADLVNTFMLQFVTLLHNVESTVSAHPHQLARSDCDRKFFFSLARKCLFESRTSKSRIIRPKIEVDDSYSSTFLAKSTALVHTIEIHLPNHKEFLKLMFQLLTFLGHHCFVDYFA